MKPLSPTQELNELDKAHSILVTLAEHGNTSAVLTTIASVLSRLPELDKLTGEPYLWADTIRALNFAADTIQQSELSEDMLVGEEEWQAYQDLLDDDGISVD